jgi:hypothetical protein
MNEVLYLKLYIEYLEQVKSTWQQRKADEIPGLID